MAEIRKLEKSTVLDKHLKTKVTKMGNVIELLTIARSCGGSPCRKIDKDHYLDVRTGELLDYKHFENRACGLESIRQTISRIRALINTNVTDSNNVRWITLTYSENMTDSKRLYTDYEKFWKRFCYWCKKQEYNKPDYITVQEPQGRGAWHVHAFFIWQTEAPFIPNDIMAKLWGQGFTKTKALANIDNPGAYFSAYLGDLPLENADGIEGLYDPFETKLTVEEKEFISDDGKSNKKKFIKGGRLYMYPVGMNIVRTTKGIKRPEVEYMTRLEAEKKVSSAKETFSCKYEILNSDGTVVNRIDKSYYNSKRKYDL